MSATMSTMQAQDREREQAQALNRAKRELAVELQDYKDGASLPMSDVLGENYRDGMGRVFDILARAGLMPTATATANTAATANTNTKGTATMTTATATATATTAATADTTAKVRRTFKVCEDAKTLTSSIAYLNASRDAFMADNPTITTADVIERQCKVNRKLELVITDNRVHGTIHLSFNSTSALDWRKVQEAFDKRVNKLIEKERKDGATPKAHTTRKHSAPTKADVVAENAALKEQLATMQAALKAAGIMC